MNFPFIVFQHVHYSWSATLFERCTDDIHMKHLFSLLCINMRVSQGLRLSHTLFFLTAMIFFHCHTFLSIFSFLLCKQVIICEITNQLVFNIHFPKNYHKFLSISEHISLFTYYLALLHSHC